jgi:hypothetical protein
MKTKTCDTANNDYSLDAFAFCNFYFSQKSNLIYTAENFAVFLVWQHTIYFCKQMLVIGYV